MTYLETLEYLFTRLPMYQRVGKVAYKKDLTNTIKLLKALDDPHLKFKSVHIAGTNGKGTSAHGIAAILQTAGYQTGLYTSPHLKNFTERIKINGVEVTEAFVIDFVNRIKPSIEEIEPSFFEITVAMAFEYFAQQKVDIAVIETGLGGRLDSTNVIMPEVSLITNIGLDHMDMLGDTLEKIAVEKAGIMKAGVPVIIGEKHPETSPVFEEIAKERNSPLTYAKNEVWTPKALVPAYLTRNYPGIKTVIDKLVERGWKIDSEDIMNGLDCLNDLTGLKGRLQVIEKQPLIIADVSHNADGLKVLLDQVNQLCKGTLHLIFGTVKDKDLKPIFDLFPVKTKCYWTQSGVPRSLAVEELAIQAILNGWEGECFQHVDEALESAKGNASFHDLILITGSTFVVGELKEI